ncbi:hypothetical protein BGW39_005450 [Mortierella sp. 14UC]|nr:hypothetical protein BGW39_005450 [Mortierella sp. 14UC]
MMKSKSLKSIGCAPSSTKDKRLSIEIHADSSITINHCSMPVSFGHLETPAVANATVTFETDQDCRCQDLKLPHNVQRKKWTWPELVRPSPGTVAAGKYTKAVSATIDPLWPSTCTIRDTTKGSAWVSYTLEVQFIKSTKTGLSSVLHTGLVEFWVVNSVLPATEAIPKPFTVHAPVQKPDLSVSLTIPNSTLHLSQQGLLTVRVAPFNYGRRRYGQKSVVLVAEFTIREKFFGWSKATAGVDAEASRDVFQIAIRERWPQNQVGSWSRAVSVTFPTTPEVTASFSTKTMDLRHSVLSTMKYKAESDKDSKAQEITVEAPFKLAAPRRYLLQAQEINNFSPTYNATDG